MSKIKEYLGKAKDFFYRHALAIMVGILVVGGAGITLFFLFG